MPRSGLVRSAATSAAAVAAALVALMPLAAHAGAFEKKTGAGEYPESIIDRPLALPKQMLIMEVGYKFRYGRDGYNNGGCAGVDATNSELIPEHCYAPSSTPGCDANMDGTPDDVGPDGGDGVPDCTTSSRTTIFTNQIPIATIGYAAIPTHIFDVSLAYGVTENWTMWVDVPLMYLTERYDVSSDPDGGAVDGVRDRSDARMLLDHVACRTRGTNVEDAADCNELPNTPGNLPKRRTFGVGDVSMGLMYQFVNFKTEGGLRRSLAAKLTFRLPSGSESTAESDLVTGVDKPETPEIEFLRRKSLITGTGTLDAGFSLAYKHAFLHSLAATLELGYLGRIEGTTQYIKQFNPQDLNGVMFFPNPDDPFTSGDFNFNGKVDFGDELFAKLNVTWAPTKRFTVDLGGKFLYRFPTRIAQAGFTPPTDVPLDENTSTTFNISNGIHYRDVPNSRGFLLTLTPTLTYRVTEAIEVSVFADVHVAGKNSFYLNNNSFNNAVDTSTGTAQEDRYNGTGVHAFLPLQALGFALTDQIILGNVGVKATFLF
ncbi:MAG TPA: hypothetical protein VG389_29600 [Myxococcota bacterium]|jgi:hypothetical protein|nr:hypothetical protein [Myxococcota bacterium]